MMVTITHLSMKGEDDVTDENRIQLIETRLTELERDVSKISLRLDTYAENAENIANKIDEIRTDVSELLVLWRNAKGFGNFTKALGSFAKWLAGVIIAVAAAWGILKKGGL